MTPSSSSIRPAPSLRGVISSPIRRNAPPRRAFRRPPMLKEATGLYAVGNQQSNNVSTERSDADKIVDGMDFGKLCDEFQCISSPSVEATARLLVRDILELRQPDSTLGFFAPFVAYKDPVRSFQGRDKYKRRFRAVDTMENPTSSVQEMVMLSTSVLKIEWTLRGSLKGGGGYLILKVTSEFTLNQISGQVIEHTEQWDISASSLQAEAYFWASRFLFAANESGKDASDLIKELTKRITSDDNKNVGMYPDITGDPTKFFFQRDDGFQQDLYQIALFLAVVYFVVQFLRATL